MVLTMPAQHICEKIGKTPQEEKTAAIELHRDGSFDIALGGISLTGTHEISSEGLRQSVAAGLWHQRPL